MFIFISKILSILIYPVGISVLLGIISVISLILNKKRIAKITSLLMIFILCFFSMPVVSHFLVRFLESKFEQPQDFPKVSAIVLLGGCTQPAVSPRKYVETNCNADRIFHAARIFKMGYAPYIICTGGKLPFIYKFEGSEAECMASLLKEFWSIDTPNVIIENKARNTHEHAPNVEKILREKGLEKKIIIVTTASHMYRSVKIFKKHGFIVYPAPTDYWEDKKIQWNIFSFLPKIEALFSSTMALHEYYGIIAYKLLGWI
jgi:uncharacterized SAM-binding protein YcdF (DUF218 family)